MRRWRFCVAAVFGLLVPYLTALAFSGGEGTQVLASTKANGSGEILVTREDTSYCVSVDEYLPGVLARQIPADYEPQTLRAQAIVARTYIYQQIEAMQLSGQLSDGKIPEEALDLDYLEEDQLKKLWGNQGFPTLYEKLETAVRSTSRMTLTFEGAYIDALFCRATAGKSRDGGADLPYLRSVECPDDAAAEAFSTSSSWKEEEFYQAIAAIDGERTVAPNGICDSVQIIARDAAGYVERVQIGGVEFTGEEVQNALGLSSSNYALERTVDGMQARAKGSGHGYGLSQWQANAMAKEGKTAEEILDYFYTNVELVTE